MDDIIRMKVASSPTKDMLSFEEWRRKISEQMEHSEQQKRDLNLLKQHQQQLLLQDSHSQGGDGSALKTVSSSSTVNGNGGGHGNGGNGKPVHSTASDSGTSQTLPTNRARNFASHECGAKIVDSNAEADFVNR